MRSINRKVFISKTKRIGHSKTPRIWEIFAWNPGKLVYEENGQIEILKFLKQKINPGKVLLKDNER